MPNDGRSGEDKDAEWILREDQLLCLASATRMDIIDHMAAHGPLSIRELAGQIGMQPSALYHHIERLLEVGLIVESGEQVSNRKSEKLYATPSRRMRLRRALSEGHYPEAMDRIVATLGRRAERDFARGQRGDDVRAEGEARNLGFFRLVSRADSRRLAKINALLEELAELMWEEPDPDGKLVALTWIMAPID